MNKKPEMNFWILENFQILSLSILTF